MRTTHPCQADGGPHPQPERFAENQYVRARPDFIGIHCDTVDPERILSGWRSLPNKSTSQAARSRVRTTNTPASRTCFVRPKRVTAPAC